MKHTDTIEYWRREAAAYRNIAIYCSIIFGCVGFVLGTTKSLDQNKKEITGSSSSPYVDFHHNASCYQSKQVFDNKPVADNRSQDWYPKR